MVEETVQEEELPVVQNDVIDQELGQDIELSVLRTLHCVSYSLTCWLQDLLQQLADVQIEVIQEDQSAATAGRSPEAAPHPRPHAAAYAFSARVQLGTVHPMPMVNWRRCYWWKDFFWNRSV